MKTIKDFYERIKKSEGRYFILRGSINVILLSVLLPIIHYIFNKFINKIDRPYYNNSKIFLVTGIIGIIIVVILDFISRRSANSKIE